MLETRVDIRVEWSHCDAARIVYNPHFFSWSETGVTTLFAAAGFALTDIMDGDPDYRGVPLVKSEATFHAPARFGDDLVLSTTIRRFGRSSFDMAHRFTRADMPIAEIAQVRVWSGVDPDDAERIKAVAIPDRIRQALEQDRTVEVRTVWSG